MPEVDTLKAEIKRLSSQSVTAKMNLHDLAEDLPTNWQQILAVAQQTFEVYKTLEEKRAELKAVSAV